MSSSRGLAAPSVDDDEAFVRKARHRTIYDVALAFYGVLTAIALTPPLKTFADSFAASLTGGGLDDWTTRLLTVALLLQAADWLHTLMVYVELSDTRSDTDVDRHSNRPSGAASYNTSRYRMSIIQFWSGALMVVIITTLGSAVARGTAAFFAVSFIYNIYCALCAAFAQRMRKDFAHSPTRADRMDAFMFWESLSILLISAGLVVWAYKGPAQGVQPFVQALVWLSVVIAEVVWYDSQYPEFYGL